MSLSLEPLYGALTAEITDLTAKLEKSRHEGASNGSSSSSEIIDAADKKIEEAEEMLEQMELEIRGLSSQVERDRGLTRLRSHQAELKRLTKLYNRTKKDSLEDVRRRSLLGEDDDIDEEDEFGHRSGKEQLLENTETLERAGRQLDRGQQLLAESEFIGAEVLSDLASQRDTLQRARNRLRDTDDNLSTSSRILSSMIWRITQSRILLVLVGAVVLVFIMGGVYFVVT